MSTQSNNNKRIAKNTLLLYVRMLFTMTISLYTSRVILRVLGIEDFGIYNVVGGVVSMLGFITGSLTGASSRFITYNIGTDDKKLVTQTFANILFIHILLSGLILLLAETLGLWFMTTKLQIPDSRMTAAMWVYQFSVLSALVSILYSPYNALIVAYEKMSAFAYIPVFDAVMKLVIVYLLNVLPFDKLISYAWLFFLIQFFDISLYFIYCRRHFEESLTFPKRNKELFHKMFYFAGWTLTGNLAAVGYTQGINILLNMFFGPVVNAARGIAVQVQNVCRNFCYNFQMAINPQITKSYASGNLDYMHTLVMKSSKFSFFIMLLITLPIMLEADVILKLWLGTVPEHTANFLRLVLCYSLLYTLQNPVVHSINAVGDLKKFQIIESSLLLTIVPISYVGLKYFGIIPEYVFAIHLCVEIVTQIVRIQIVLPKISMSIKKYYVNVVVPLFKFGVFSAIFPIVCYFLIPSSNIWYSAILCILSVVSVTLTFYAVACSKQERLFVNEKIRALTNRVFIVRK